MTGMRICLVLILVCSLLSGYSQTEEITERLSERLEQTVDFTDLIEDLEETRIKPVDLNKATALELNKIPVLTGPLIHAFLEYQKSYGEILSYYELNAIPGFDSALITRLIPYICIGTPATTPPLSPKNIVKLGRHQLLVRYGQAFPKSNGYFIHDTATGSSDAGYPGEPQHYYFRYTYTYFDKLKIGLAGEKDPGEQFFRGAQQFGMDYYSGYLALTNLGILRNLVIGNFRAGFGQGLTFGTGLTGGSIPGFSAGGMTLGQVKGSLSMSEGNSFRGIAGTVKIKKIEISGFLSWKNRDGNIINQDSLETKVVEFSSLQSTGLHRTQDELQDRDAISELIAGGNLNITGSFFRVGITGYYSRWSGFLVPRLQPYNQFSLSGKENFNLGFDFQARSRYAYFFGEISRSRNGGVAFLTGFIADPDSRFKVTCLVRNYPRDYQNLFSNAFGQQSMNINEQGFYLNIQASLFRRLFLSGYADVYRFPWLKYRVGRPSPGFEMGIMLTSPLSSYVNLYARYIYNTWSVNASPGENMTYKIEEARRQAFRVQIDWGPVPGFSFKDRFEVNMTGSDSQEKKYGYLFLQDISYKPEKIPLNIGFRYALFEIPEYGSRIYAYEPEVLYGYSVPAFFGKGFRICLLLSGKITRHFSWWIKGGITNFLDRMTNGSGLDLVEGNKKIELTGQIMVRL